MSKGSGCRTVGTLQDDGATVHHHPRRGSVVADAQAARIAGAGLQLEGIGDPGGREEVEGGLEVLGGRQGHPGVDRHRLAVPHRERQPDGDHVHGVAVGVGARHHLRVDPLDPDPGGLAVDLDLQVLDGGGIEGRHRGLGIGGWIGDLEIEGLDEAGVVEVAEPDRSLGAVVAHAAVGERDRHLDIDLGQVEVVGLQRDVVVQGVDRVDPLAGGAIDHPTLGVPQAVGVAVVVHDEGDVGDRIDLDRGGLDRLGQIVDPAGGDGGGARVHQVDAPARRCHLAVHPQGAAPHHQDPVGAHRGHRGVDAARQAVMDRGEAARDGRVRGPVEGSEAGEIQQIPDRQGRPLACDRQGVVADARDHLSLGDRVRPVRVLVLVQRPPHQQEVARIVGESVQLVAPAPPQRGPRPAAGGEGGALGPVGGGEAEQLGVRPPVDGGDVAPRAPLEGDGALDVEGVELVEVDAARRRQAPGGAAVGPRPRAGVHDRRVCDASAQVVGDRCVPSPCGGGHDEVGAGAGRIPLADQPFVPTGVADGLIRAGRSAAAVLDPGGVLAGAQIEDPAGGLAAVGLIVAIPEDLPRVAQLGALIVGVGAVGGQATAVGEHRAGVLQGPHRQGEPLGLGRAGAAGGAEPAEVDELGEVLVEDQGAVGDGKAQRVARQLDPRTDPVGRGVVQPQIRPAARRVPRPGAASEQHEAPRDRPAVDDEGGVRGEEGRRGSVSGLGSGGAVGGVDRLEDPAGRRRGRVRAAGVAVVGLVVAGDRARRRQHDADPQGRRRALHGCAPRGSCGGSAPVDP